MEGNGAKMLTERLIRDCGMIHGGRIAAHYAKARLKHPVFCDKLLRRNEDAEEHLELCRGNMRYYHDEGRLDFIDLADCELAEFYLEWRNGKVEESVEELYDVVAVILRAVDVIEGRQKLNDRD